MEKRKGQKSIPSYYEVMGLPRDCSTEEIRAAYKKLALQRHPDKLTPLGMSQTKANAMFQELLHAYTVLSNPVERSIYDARENYLTSYYSTSFEPPDLKLKSYCSNSAFSGYSNTGRGFYKVYSDIFMRIHKVEKEFAQEQGHELDLSKHPPQIGDETSPYNNVKAFYDYWLHFSSIMDFSWLGFGDPPQCQPRFHKRSVKQFNRLFRRKGKRKYELNVIRLATLVMERDKRIIEMDLKRNEEAKSRHKEAEQKRWEEEQEKKKERRWEQVKEYYEEIYWEKVALEEEEEEDEAKKEEWYCLACGSKFKSKNQWKNHEQSKKHRAREEAMLRKFREEEEDL